MSKLEVKSRFGDRVLAEFEGDRAEIDEMLAIRQALWAESPEARAMRTIERVFIDGEEIPWSGVVGDGLDMSAFEADFNST